MGWSSGNTGGGAVDVSSQINAAILTHSNLQVGVHGVPTGYKVMAMKTPSGGFKFEVKHESDAGSNTIAGEPYINAADGENI